EAVVKAAAEASACWVNANPLFLKSCARQVFLPFIKQHFPHLEKIYRERYGERDFATPEYSRRISALVRKLCEKHRVGRRGSGWISQQNQPQLDVAEQQMNLFQ